MEYEVCIKNVFNRDAVLEQLKGGRGLLDFFGGASLDQRYLPGTNTTFSPAVLSRLHRVNLGRPPVRETADYALYYLSSLGGMEKDYYRIDSRTLLYDRHIRWAYWERPAASSSDDDSIIQQDLVDTAKVLNIEVEIMMAIAKQESHGGGFFRNGKPKILFERHKMYQHLRDEGHNPKELEKLHPNIVNHKPGGYGPSSTQHQRLEEARKLDEEAAIMSASWGRFQIMGETYKYLYDTPQELEKAMNASEKQQLKYFAAFVRKKAGGRLLIALRNKRWETVATLYNGDNWRKTNPNYVRNIQNYYAEFKRK